MPFQTQGNREQGPKQSRSRENERKGSQREQGWKMKGSKDPPPSNRASSIGMGFAPVFAPVELLGFMVLSLNGWSDLSGTLQIIFGNNMDTIQKHIQNKHWVSKLLKNLFKCSLQHSSFFFKNNLENCNLIQNQIKCVLAWAPF